MKTPALALVAVSLLLAGCGGSGGSKQATTAGPGTSTISALPTLRVIPIAIKDGKPLGGITRVTAKKGQLIQLIVQSDVADEVHLHGYDLHEDVKAGGTAEIQFRATITGVFEAELEQRGLEILELTVE